MLGPTFAFGCIDVDVQSVRRIAARTTGAHPETTEAPTADVALGAVLRDGR